MLRHPPAAWFLVAALGCSAAKGATARKPKAVRITRASELLRGPAAVGRLGDFLLSNGLVSAVVDRLGPGQMAAESGGNLVDVAPEGGNDYLCQIFTFFAEDFPRQAVYETVALASSETEASVTVRGRDLLDANLRVETTYVLPAEARHVLIRTTVGNRGTKTVAGFGLGDVINWGHAERFVPGQAQRAKGKLKVPWVAGAGSTSSFLYGATGGRELPGIHGNTWSDLVIEKPDLPPGASVTYERFVAIGERGDYASASDVAWPLLGRTGLGTLSGAVTEVDTKKPVAAVVIVLGGDAPVTTIATDLEGRFATRLPAGRYVVTTLSRDRAAVATKAVVLEPERASAPVALEVTTPGALEVTMTSGGAASAGKLILEGIDGTVDPDLGAPHLAAGAGNTAVTHEGRLSLVLPPGRYRATCARGIEFDVDVHEIDVHASRWGQPPRKLACDLRRAVETPGRIGMDLHQHAVPSYDAAVSLEDRLKANLAEGVEGFVASDHNVITDYTAAIRKLGVGKRLFAIPGDEATAEGLGHFNAFPITPRPALPKNGAPAVSGRSAEAIFKLLRALPGGDKVIQVNHPRTGREGYFDRIKLDLGKPGYPEGWASDFDAVEIVNGKRLNEVEPALRDWFELLRRGKKVTAVGNSDTHTVFGTESGYPRNLIAVAKDDPTRVTTAEIVRAIKVRRDVVVTNGPILSVTIGKAGPGGRTPAGPDPAKTPVKVRIEAAPWVDVDRIEIYVDGKLATNPPVVVPRSRERLRADRTIPVAAPAGSFVVVMARGSATLAPVVSNQDRRPITPLAIANPIWIDGKQGRGKTK